MIHKRRGLVLLGTTAICLAAIAPTQVADGRLPRWMNLFADVKDGWHHAADSVRHAFDFRWRSAPSRTASADSPSAPAPTAAPSAAGPTLAKPQAVTDANALKQAYAVAAANDRIRALGYDPVGIQETIAAYHADDLVAGDALALKIKDPLIRTALEWVALRNVPQKIGMDRLVAFDTTHKDWPAPRWFRAQMEARLLRLQDPRAVESFFTTSPPETALGKYALAKALRADGRPADGIRLARALYRETEMTPYLEGRLKADFGADLAPSDFKYRADRLLYKEQIAPAMRAAALAGPDEVAIAKARAAVIAEAPSDKAIAAVPAALRSDPGLIFAEAQKLRRADKLLEAAHLIQSAPRDAAKLVDGDEWWTERRVLARKLLDTGNVTAAYVICATHTAVSSEAKIEAEFHAGWIALRFMNDPTRAAYHFATAAKLAETPTSIARVAYWQGRTAENIDTPDATTTARAFYAIAAAHGSTYYGQLARATLGLKTDPVREPAQEATGPQRVEAVRVIELLYAAGDKDSAYALAVDAASHLADDKQVAALATVIASQRDAHLALTIGKLTGRRGIPVDTLAFPTFGIPRYDALQNSAEAPVVYSIARQESAFLPGVVSKAGAKGLMQMIDSTARRTATKAGLPFDGARMTSDAAFNAQLGAAHLGALLAEQGGSYILTFAAYNAGGGRVKQWIDAYGDPRTPGVDPIDWVERIPFTETRNYVQRVMANVTMYKAIFADEAKTGAATDDHEAKL
jgi:soluble lytic murein transglycosylase